MVADASANFALASVGAPSSCSLDPDRRRPAPPRPLGFPRRLRGRRRRAISVSRLDGGEVRARVVMSDSHAADARAV